MARSKDRLEIYFPVPDESEVADGLRRITKVLSAMGTQAHLCGVFGGEFGYGTDFENDVFAMHSDRQHPRCTCGATMPKHTEHCDQVTKRQAWLDTRNMIGMVKHEPHKPPEGREETEYERFVRVMMSGWYHNTPTTYDEQEAWMKANPFPDCTCGGEAEFIARRGHEPKDEYDYDHREEKHVAPCDWTKVYTPHFIHKPSGSTVEWYKYIGRDMNPDLKVEWSVIEAECMASLAQEPTP